VEVRFVRGGSAVSFIIVCLPVAALFLRLLTGKVNSQFFLHLFRCTISANRWQLNKQKQNNLQIRPLYVCADWEERFLKIVQFVAYIP